MIAAAAEVSGPLAPVSNDGVADWVTALPASEKDKFLTMVAEGEGAQVEALLAGAEARRSAREAAMARAREEARARRAAEQAAAYERHLGKLSGSKDEAWQDDDHPNTIKKSSAFVPLRAEVTENVRTVA